MSVPESIGQSHAELYGKSRARISDLLPYHKQIADELCFIKSMHTEHINHDPAITFIQTGNQIGRPSMGSWMSYGLGGLLDDTLVVWGGEFGRNSYSRGKLTKENYGRDHHPRCFSIYLTGGGVKRGISYGQTDEFGYNIVKDPVHIHDLQATIMHLMGVDHEQLTFKFQGRRYRLTDVPFKQTLCTRR